MSGPYRTSAELPRKPRQRSLRGRLRSFRRRVVVWWLGRFTERRDARKWRAQLEVLHSGPRVPQGPDIRLEKEGRQVPRTPVRRLG